MALGPIGSGGGDWRKNIPTSNVTMLGDRRLLPD